MHCQFNPTSRRVGVFTDRVATRSAGLMTGRIWAAGVSAARGPPQLADDGRAIRRGVIRVECAESRLDRRGGRVADLLPTHQHGLAAHRADDGAAARARADVDAAAASAAAGAGRVAVVPAAAAGTTEWWRGAIR